jgi:hypothetical protein
LGYRTDGRLLSRHLALTVSFSCQTLFVFVALHSDGVFVWLVDRIWRVVWNASNFFFTISIFTYLSVCFCVFEILCRQFAHSVRVSVTPSSF